MAKLPALISALASCDDRSHKQLDNISRIVREAGFIRTTQRGGGASEMSWKDATNYLIGASGCYANNEAPEIIERFRSLRLKHGHTEWQGAAFLLVTEAETFGEALEGLIRFAPSFTRKMIEFVAQDGATKFADDLEGYVSQFAPLIIQPGVSTELANIRSRISFQRWSAEISIECFVGIPDDAEWVPALRLIYGVDAELFSQGFYGPMDGDRKVVSSVGWPTIHSLWNCVSGGDVEKSIVDLQGDE